jgi:large subunit ribosomal protein L17
MATSLIIHKRIATTTAKAKALRTYVEPLITKSKEDSTHSRRVVFSYLKDKTAVAELFREVSPKIAERKGGYTRILKIGNRIGDNADMCIMELVDYNEAMIGGEAAKTKTTRRRKTTKKKEESDVDTKAPKTPKAKVEKAEKAGTKTEEPTTGESVPDAE